MSYLLIDDSFAGHKKMSGLPVRAKWLHLTALCYCAEKLTDGVISRHGLAIIGATAEVAPAKYVAHLVERGIWITDEDGWTIHDYLEYNPTAAQVKEKRANAAERQKKWRDAHRDVTGQFTSDETRDVTRYETPPHPIPSHESVSSSQAFTSYDANGGEDFADAKDYNHALDMLIAACGNTPDARKKLTQDVEKYGAPEARLVTIRWAVMQPGTTSPLGKARSMLKDRDVA